MIYHIRRLKRRARAAGYCLVLFAWAMLTGALGDLPNWGPELVVIIGGGLIIWGSSKTKLDVLERAHTDFKVELEKRASKEMLTVHMEHINGRFDRLEDRLNSVTIIDRRQEPREGE